MSDEPRNLTLAESMHIYGRIVPERVGWLRAEFARARARSAEVPERARPQVLDRATTPIPGDGHPA